MSQDLTQQFVIMDEDTPKAVMVQRDGAWWIHFVEDKEYEVTASQEEPRTAFMIALDDILGA